MLICLNILLNFCLIVEFNWIDGFFFLSESLEFIESILFKNLLVIIFYYVILSFLSKIFLIWGILFLLIIGLVFIINLIIYLIIIKDMIYGSISIGFIDIIL